MWRSWSFPRFQNYKYMNAVIIARNLLVRNKAARKKKFGTSLDTT